MWNLIIGLLMIAAGLSGEFKLMFFDGPAPLLILGAVLAIWGAYQLVRQHSSR
jgi:hypothetical protein